MDKNIKATANFEITLRGDSYEFHYDQVAENELGALMIVRELLKCSKETLKESLKQAHGNHLKMVKDRLGKITTSEYTITMMIESVIAEFLDHETTQKQEEIGQHG